MKQRVAPSKMCPHRYCRTMHWAMLTAVFVVQLTSPALWMQILALIGLGMQGYAWWMRRAYQLPHRMNGDRPNPYLIVRRGWARAAFVGDCSLFLLALYVLVANIEGRAAGVTTSDANAALMSAPLLGVLILIAIVFGYLGLIVFCHWMATRRGKPKRVKVPRGVVFHGGAA